MSQVYISNPNGIYDGYYLDHLVVLDHGWKAQTFTPDFAFVLDSINVKGWQTGLFDGDITFSICTTDESGKPTSTVLGATTVEASSFSASPTPSIENIVFSPRIPLEAGVKYAIEVSSFDGDASNYIVWYGWMWGSTYAGGKAWECLESEGYAWKVNAAVYDFYFECCGNIAPGITSQDPSVDTTVEEGSIASLSVVATGDPAPEYQWKKDDVGLSGETNSTLSFTADRTDTGTYKCRVYNVLGEVYSNPVILTVQYIEITVQPGNITVAKGQLAAFTVIAIGIPAPSYQWYKGDQILSGKTSSSLSFYCDFADAGSYQCKVSNVVDDVWSSSATLTVVSNPWRYNIFKLQSDIDRN
jgi:hypothetical protein